MAGGAEGKASETKLSRAFAKWIYLIAAAITVVTLIVYTTKLGDWRVNEFTFALLVFLVLIPIAERVRKLKAFGVEADFDALEGEVNNLRRVVADQGDKLSDPQRPGAATPRAVAEPEGEAAPPAIEFRKTIDRVIWVDDEPEGNRVEITELQRRFAVTTARTTQEGLNQLGSGEDAAVFTDAVRVEGGKTNPDAGRELIEAVKRRNSAVQVYVYCGQSTVEEHADPLESAGARLVTASFVELSRLFRSDARASFESEVEAILDAAGRPQREVGVDFTVEVGGKRVAIVAKDYRRTPKKDPLDRAMESLKTTIDGGRVDLGLVVSPRDVFTAAQRERAPQGVELIAIQDLAPRLLGLG